VIGRPDAWSLLARGLLPVPDLLQTLGTPARNAGLVGMGAAT
jgi:hypothetical protein